MAVLLCNLLHDNAVAARQFKMRHLGCDDDMPVKPLTVTAFEDFATWAQANAPNLTSEEQAKAYGIYLDNLADTTKLEPERSIAKHMAQEWFMQRGRQR